MTRKYNEYALVPTPDGRDPADWYHIAEGDYFEIPKIWPTSVIRNAIAEAPYKWDFAFRKHEGLRYVVRTTGLQIERVWYTHPVYHSPEERAKHRQAAANEDRENGKND